MQQFNVNDLRQPITTGHGWFLEEPCTGAYFTEMFAFLWVIDLAITQCGNSNGILKGCPDLVFLEMCTFCSNALLSAVLRF